MTMQYDVKSAHLTQSGFLTANNRARIKQVLYAGNGSQAGNINLFDTAVAPTSATYGRSGTTITVSKSSHGLTTGTTIGIGFNIAAGAQATDGNYAITVTDANTFTITDINSGTVTPGTACVYVVAYPNGDTRYQNPQRWIAQYDTVASQTSTTQVIVPGEGMLCANGVYANCSTIGFVSIIYG
jgi:hypothetical protein